MKRVHYRGRVGEFFCGRGLEPSEIVHRDDLQLLTYPVIRLFRFCAIKDVYSNRIVGYSIDSRMKKSLVVAALDNAVSLRGDVRCCVVHSDRGSQFRSKSFTKRLKTYHLHGSMGRVGACADNAAMESFFSLLQKNVLDTRQWETRLELRLAIVTWIERTYHRRRRQVRLGKMTPIQYEETNMRLNRVA